MSVACLPSITSLPGGARLGVNFPPHFRQRLRNHCLLLSDRPLVASALRYPPSHFRQEVTCSQIRATLPIGPSERHQLFTRTCNLQCARSPVHNSAPNRLFSYLASSEGDASTCTYKNALFFALPLC